SILLPDGTIAAGAKSRMEEEFLLEALRWMMKSRLYDQRVIALQRQGQFGVFSPGTGQEASIIGSAMAVDPSRDWMVPQYRELMATVHHGLPLEVISAQYLGKIAPARIPDGVKVLPTQVSIAAQLPQATGLAWGLRLRGEDSVVMAGYDAACDAVERARNGGGPSLIEAVTYRMSFHNTTDNPSRYQDPKEFEEARTRDPIERVQKYLAGLGLWDGKRETAWTEELREENEHALEHAAG